jgi:hypothetical protein
MRNGSVLMIIHTEILAWHSPRGTEENHATKRASSADVKQAPGENETGVISIH